jgi:hypothetical protein
LAAQNESFVTTTININAYSDALVVLAAAGVVVPIVRRLGINPVISYLGTGAILARLFHSDFSVPLLVHRRGGAERRGDCKSRRYIPAIPGNYAAPRVRAWRAIGDGDIRTHFRRGNSDRSRFRCRRDPQRQPCAVLDRDRA